VARPGLLSPSLDQDRATSELPETTLRVNRTCGAAHNDSRGLVLSPSSGRRRKKVGDRVDRYLPARRKRPLDLILRRGARPFPALVVRCDLQRCRPGAAGSGHRFPLESFR
jgi:hypothetical protein